jgi:outer membrane protein assembly factor BamB
MAYGSPMLTRVDAFDQIVIVNSLGVAAVNAADGKVLWKYSHPCKIPIPNVTALGGGKFFVTGAYLAGSSVIQVSHSQPDGKDAGVPGDRWEVKELTSKAQMGGHCHPALLYQNHLYLLCNINERSDGMVCFDVNGNVVWQTKNSPNLDKGGSILTGDGLMYVMDGRSGDLHIVEPSPTGFKSLAKAKVLDGKEIWGPLALAGGKLVLRDQTQLKCIDLQPR